MMLSGKPPSHKVFTNNGATPTPSSKDPSSGVGLTQQQPRAGKSENCDPNLSIAGKKARQKFESAPVLGDHHRDDSGNANGTILQLPEHSDPAGDAHSESAAGGLENHAKEVNRTASKLAFSSPKKAPVPAHSECDEFERQSKVINRPVSKSSIPSPSKAPAAARSECDAAGELERQSKVANWPATKTSLPSPTKATAGAAHPECDAGGELERQGMEVHRPATSKLSQITSPRKSSLIPSPTKSSLIPSPTKSSLIPSPTKSSLIPSPSKAPLVAHQHGHSPRPHHCRSPYCASNNPDYATKASPEPRKYLVSKRHLVPGAICTKDPAVLASQSQETAVSHAPSTGKPPKPSRKLENALRQPSFTSVSERSTAPISHNCSPTRIPKPPSARSPGVQDSTPLTDQLSSAVSALLAPASETHSPSFPAVSEQSASERSSDHREFSQDILSNVDDSEHLSCAGSDSSYTVAVASTSPRTSDAGQICEDSVVGSPLESSSVISAGEPGSEEPFVSPESPIQLIPAELPAVSPASDQFSTEPEAPVFAATKASAVPLSTELEDVTQTFAQKLAFETVEEPSVHATDCNPTEDILSGDGIDGRPKSEQCSTISRDEDAEEHISISTSSSGLRVPEENGDEVGSQAEENTDGGDSQAEADSAGGDYPAAQNDDEGDYETGKAVNGENFQFRSDVPVFGDSPSSDETEGETGPGGRPVASYIEELENAQGKLPEGQREVPKYVRGKGRQLWRSDCRDSREVVFLKQTPQTDRRAGGDWMVNDVLEGAISRLNSCGKGRVRVLVEAFESMMNLGGDSDSSERRASRVWCLNRMEKGEVDEDGEEFEDGDQRVDCYEVSGDGLQLRASMRLSLGGGNRLPLYHSDEGDEIEMSAIQKVQEWDDDRRESQSLEDQDCGPLRSSQSQPDGAVLHDQETHSEDRSANTELAFANLQRRISFSGSHTVLGENDRSSEDSGCDAQTENQFNCYTSDDGLQRVDERSTFSLDLDCKYKASRRRRYWKASSANGEPTGPSSVGGGPDKDRRITRGTMLEPFRLHTEERGMMKEYQFSKKLQQMLEEEERLRNPVAQGLPWTTDFPEVVPKPTVKEQTRPVEFRHYSNSRAIERADFDSYISERSEYMEMQRQEEERLRIQAEQEEIKRLRREMVPKAQLMPFFDQPFIPTRSSKRLTVPKEPTFLNRQHKRAKCIVWQHQHQPCTTQAYQ